MRSGCSPETDDKLKFLLGHIDKAVADFVGDAEQFDDLTMMCLEYHGPRDGVENREEVNKAAIPEL